jgi:hypothetical protein
MDTNMKQNVKTALKRIGGAFLAAAILGIPAAYEAHAIYEGLAESTASAATAQDQAPSAAGSNTNTVTDVSFMAPMPETPYLPPHRPHPRPRPRYYSATFNVSSANGETPTQAHVQMVDNGTVSPERREALQRAYREQQDQGNECAPYGTKPVLLCFKKGVPRTPQLLRIGKPGGAFYVDP